MTSGLPSPPASRASTPNGDQDVLSHQLDQLLEQYLEILDKYSILREKLSRHFSAGFMSLANAQRTSNLGPGRRYGQDGYDGRMKALKRVDTGQGGLIGSPTHDLQVSTGKSADEPTTALLTKGKLEVVSYDYQNSNIIKPVMSSELSTQTKQVHSNSPSDDNATPVHVTSGNTSEAQKKPIADPAYRDPVTWYGILVPPALRQAQQSFSVSIQDSIPNLLSTVILLRDLEAEIMAIRASLGIQNQYHSNAKVPNMV